MRRMERREEDGGKWSEAEDGRGGKIQKRGLQTLRMRGQRQHRKTIGKVHSSCKF